jgi:protein phosphatase
MSFNFQSVCDQGAVRPNNEDAVNYGIHLTQNFAWAIIADGMGGHLAGEVASELLIDEIESAINELVIEEQHDWLCWIEIELNRANNRIFAESKTTPKQSGMGTTAVLVIIDQFDCYIGWVGDSRGYLYRAEQQPSLQQLTQDHTMIQMLLDKGAISPRDAENSTSKNMLSRAIGVKRGVDVETTQLKLKNNDIILLSTDGLHDSLDEKQFISSISKIESGEHIANELIEKAISGGSKDNITFASIQIVND